MTLNLVDFYKDLLKVFDIEADEQGRLFIRSSKAKLPITLDGKPLVLPTYDNIKNSVEIVNGKPELTMVIFNPLKETATRGENKTLLKFKDILERKVNHSFAIVGEVLFSLLSANLGEIENPELINFIQELNKYKAPGIKHIVDENTVKNWVEIYKAIVKRPTNEQYMHTVLKRGGRIGDKKYNRTCTITFPVYEKLSAINPKKETFYNVKIRNKDKSAYQVFHQYTFELDDETLKYGYSIGSENLISPAMESLLMAYEFIKDHINNIIDILKEEKYDVDYLEEARLKDLPIKIEDLGVFLEAVKAEVKEIPTENELELQAQIQQTVETNTINNSQQAIPTTQQEQTVDDEDPINKILQNIGANQPTLQPTLQQAFAQQTSPQPQYQQPMMNVGGYNPGIQQPIMNNMYNQPQPIGIGYQQPQPTGFNYQQPTMNPNPNMNQGFGQGFGQPFMNQLYGQM